MHQADRPEPTTAATPSDATPGGRSSAAPEPGGRPSVPEPPGGRSSAVPEPALAVLGAAAWLGEAVADGLADWSDGYARLADRGAVRATRLLPAAYATRRAGAPAVQLDWDVRDAIDELQERGEEIVAYAELYRWRLLRRGRRMLTRPLAGLADSALRGLAPITHPRRPADLGPLPPRRSDHRPATRRAG